jgi:hypothetical protein
MMFVNMNLVTVEARAITRINVSDEVSTATSYFQALNFAAISASFSLGLCVVDVFLC